MITFIVPNENVIFVEEDVIIRSSVIWDFSGLLSPDAM